MRYSLSSFRIIKHSVLMGVVGVLAVASLALPRTTYGFGAAANAICQTTCPMYEQQGHPEKCTAQTCSDPGSGTSGHCVTGAHVCMGTTAGDGSSLQGLGQLLQGVASLISALKGSGSGSGSGSAGTGTTGGTSTLCPNGNYTVTVPSTDPCAVYQPSGVSDSLNGSSSAAIDLASLLGGGSTGDALTNALGGITNTGGDTNTNTNTNTAGYDVTTGGANTIPAPSASSTLNGTQAQVQPQGNGVHGDLKIDAGGVTAFASNQDQAHNKTVAAFFGVDAGASFTPTVIATQMCIYRPWASNFLASVVPATFFDGLCTLHNFKVGLPAPVITPVTSTTPKPKPTPTATSTATTTAPVVGYTGPNVPAQVQIWAVPASVPLGSRTSIFWNSQGVYNCTVTSPDGSFNQNTTSGGASTVPLTSDTTYTISCLKPDNTPATAFTTVHLSI
jgi:hypothetical protein